MSYLKEIILYKFKELLVNAGQKEFDKIVQLKADASDRKIYRIFASGKSYIGIYNEHPDENKAFIEFSKAFRQIGLNVPEIISEDKEGYYYIEEDLGDITLFQFCKAHSDEGSAVMDKYKEALSWLPKFQIEAAEKLDYDLCYQTKEFNKSMLESDFDKFAKYYYKKEISSNIKSILYGKILSENYPYFMYRDFQPRNIMVKGGELYFIDYQSGRRGPLQYDAASFLYSGSINITEDERSELLSHYLGILEEKYKISREDFENKFPYFALSRLIQVLGSYTYLYESRRDPFLLLKIPKATANLKSIEEKFEEREIKEFIEEVRSIEDRT